MEIKIGRIDYLKIFKDALKLSWQNRYLWWFGLFVTTLNLGGMNFYPKEMEIGESEKIRALDFISQNAQWLVVVLIAAVFLCFLFSAFALIGRGALISSINRILKGEKSNFKSGFYEGLKYFWKLFFISLSFGFFIISSIIVFFTPIFFLFLNKNYIFGVAMAILALLIFFPLLVLTAFIKNYAQLYTVLGRLSFWDSLENAYNLFLKNIWHSFLLVLLFIPVGIIFMIAVLSALLFVGSVFLGIGLVLFLILQKTGIIIAFILAGIFLIPIIFLVKSFYEVFAQAVWVLFFHQIAGPKEEVLEEEKVPHLMPDSGTATVTESKIS